MSTFNREQAEFWANRELDRDENGLRVPRLADCDWPKDHLRRALEEIDRLTSLHHAAYIQSESYLRHWDDAAKERDDAKAEVARMRPVYKAANNFYDLERAESSEVFMALDDLRDAVIESREAAAKEKP